MKQQSADPNGPEDNTEKPPAVFIEGGRGWPIQLAWLRRPPLWFSGTLCALAFLIIGILLISSLIAIARIGVSISAGSATEASDASKALLPVAAAAIGLPLIIWRLVILAQQTRIAEEKGQIDRETQYTTIFSKSVEQLGATREVKERASPTSTEIVSKTVPNIEMRLGAIHSLFRLSAESKKDKPKIEKMLISYIKENSWHDNSGARLARCPKLTFEDPFDWAYNLGQTRQPDDEDGSYTKWLTLIDSETQEVNIWANSIIESRSDISEIVIGFPTPTQKDNLQIKREYRDSLFVDVSFPPESLNDTSFNRCTFVRCNFSPNRLDNFDFEECVLYNCKIIGSSSKIYFHICRFYSTSFVSIEESALTLSLCKLLDSSIKRGRTCSVLLDWCSTTSLSFKDCKDLTLNINESSNIAFSMRGSQLSKGSTFDNSCFVASKFHSTDLRAWQIDDIKIFANCTATRNTIHPGADRPAHWPSLTPTLAKISNEIHSTR